MRKKGEGARHGRKKFPLFSVKKEIKEKKEKEITVDRVKPVVAPKGVDPFLALHGSLQQPNTGVLQEQLKQAIFRQLKIAMETKNTGSYEAQVLVAMHKEWICLFWKEGMYSKKAHLRLTDIYVAEPRFAMWYDGVVGRGGAQFLRDSVEVAMFRVGMPLPSPTREAILGEEDSSDARLP